MKNKLTKSITTTEERTLKDMQEQISDANVQRHLLSLSVRNLDRKINIIIKSRKMQLEGRVEEDESVEQEVCCDSVLSLLCHCRSNMLLFPSTKKCSNFSMRVNNKRILWEILRR